MKKMIALAALAALSAGASASTNLIADGSFESEVTAAGTYRFVTAPAAWTVTKTTGGSATLEVRNNAVGAAEDGVNFIELDGNENDKISQTLSGLVIGQTYDVSFWFSDRTGVAAGSEGWSLKIGSDYTASQAGGGFNTSGGNQWQHFTGSFTATSTSDVFSLWGTGKSDSYGTSIDNISVTAAIPEPSTLGLFAAGLAALGLSARRRKQQ